MADPIDKDILKNRRDMASRLFQAREKGLAKTDALASEAGVGIGGHTDPQNVDNTFKTNLTEQQISNFADRLYAGKYGSGSKAIVEGSPSMTEPQPSKVKENASMFGGLARLESLQNRPLGSSPMGATGVQGAVGGLARGTSPTRGTPIGTGTKLGGAGGTGLNQFGDIYKRLTGLAQFRVSEEEKKAKALAAREGLELKKLQGEVDLLNARNTGRLPEVTYSQQ